MKNILTTTRKIDIEVSKQPVSQSDFQAGSQKPHKNSQPAKAIQAKNWRNQKNKTDILNKTKNLFIRMQNKSKKKSREIKIYHHALIRVKSVNSVKWNMDNNSVRVESFVLLL